MSHNETMTYVQMVEMTELVLKDLRNWVNRQYGWYVMTLQICIVMLRWGVAQTADESIFLVQWIQAWSKICGRQRCRPDWLTCQMTSRH